MAERRRLIGTAVVAGTALAVLAGCGSATPGEMTTQTYRSLQAQQSTLTVDEARERGAAQGAELEQSWTDAGGAPAATGTDCWYAETMSMSRYRGTARFCFDADGTAVSVDLARGDLQQ